MILSRVRTAASSSASLPIRTQASGAGGAAGLVQERSHDVLEAHALSIIAGTPRQEKRGRARLSRRVPQLEIVEGPRVVERADADEAAAERPVPGGQDGRRHVVEVGPDLAGRGVADDLEARAIPGRSGGRRTRRPARR